MKKHALDVVELHTCQTKQISAALDGNLPVPIQPTDYLGFPTFFWHVDEDWLPDEMTRNEALLYVSKCFELYNPAIPWVRFVPVSTPVGADITFRWMKNGDLGLPYRFDENTLAYVIVGDADVYMNSAVSWAGAWRNDAYPIQIVAAHEVGHSTALPHSNIQASMMYWQILRGSQYGKVTDDMKERNIENYGKYMPEVVVTPNPTPDPEVIANPEPEVADPEVVENPVPEVSDPEEKSCFDTLKALFAKKKVRLRRMPRPVLLAMASYLNIETSRKMHTYQIVNEIYLKLNK